MMFFVHSFRYKDATPMINHVHCCLLFVVCCCFEACTHRRGRSEIRPEIQRVFNTVDSSLAEKKAVEPIRSFLDSMLVASAPLSNAEKLQEYGFYWWYYINHLWGKHEAANRIADSALAIFDDEAFRQNNQEAYQAWLFNKGDMLVELKKLQEAFHYYHRAKSELAAKWDACKMSRYSVRLGRVRYRQANYEDALRYYKQALEEVHGCLRTQAPTTYYESVTEHQGILNGIGWFFDLLNQPDSALHYYNQALAFLDRAAVAYPEDETDTETARAVVYGNMGGLYAKMGRYEDAEHYLRESVAINKNPWGDKRDVLTAQIKLADLYIQTGHLPAADQLLGSSREGLDSLPSENFEQRWRRVNWLYHDKLGDVSKAYRAFRHYHVFKDSLVTVNQRMMAADFVGEFESIEKNKDLEALRVKNRFNFFFLVVSFVALAMTLCIVYLIYTNWQRSKRNVNHLKALNQSVNEKNEKLQLALLALQDSQQDNTRIMAMVAHDLKASTANIEMSSEIMMQHTTSLTDEEKVFLGVINKSASQTLRLIEELMHSYERDALADMDAIDLETMVRDCVEVMHVRANEKQQTIEVASSSVIFRGSREKMWRVISNLITNAIKFTPRNGRIEVTLQSNEREAVIKVQDNGIGIPHEFQDLLFEMGKAASRLGTEGEPSTGLGLAIVKQIISAYEGKIYVVSQPNMGAAFHVHLPI